MTFLSNENPVEFSVGTASWGSGIVAAVAWVQSLAWELPYAMGRGEEKKKLKRAGINYKIFPTSTEKDK